MLEREAESCRGGETGLFGPKAAATGLWNAQLNPVAAKVEGPKMRHQALAETVRGGAP